MRARSPIDLSSYLNLNVAQGSPADFPVRLEPIFISEDGTLKDIPHRRAVVREDTGQAIAVVSNRYVVMPHTRILDVIEEAIRPLDVGPVPRGIYVDRSGARMRAIFKFPSLARPVLGDNEICPCLQVRNTYDASGRIALHIGAFRIVCTNLAVGGGGAFAGGFVSIHAGEIPIETISGQLVSYLSRFDQIVRLYRQWSEQRPQPDNLRTILMSSLNGRFDDVRDDMLAAMPTTVFDAYNRLTHHATHNMRSAKTAFDMLERVNISFQEVYPAIEAEVIDGTADRHDESPQEVGQL